MNSNMTCGGCGKCGECKGGVCGTGSCGKCGCGSSCAGSMVGKILVIIGAISWGIIGIGGFMGGDWNIVNMILGNWPEVEWIVYILVGIAGVMAIFGCRCKKCVGECGCCGNGTCAPEASSKAPMPEEKVM